MSQFFSIYFRRVLLIYQMSHAPLSKGGQRLCPVCGHHILRIHRKPLDRIISLFIEVRRYRCQNHQCEWEGRVSIGD